MCYLQKEITEEEVLRSQPHAEELVLVYSGGCLPRAARIRRTPLGARKVEMATIRFPVQRSKVKTSKKENFNSCGEATTFQGTYSGVAFRPLSEMPMIALEEKKKVLASLSAVPAAPDTWQDVHGEDLPLFWQESKPIAFYQALIDEHKIKSVFDITAGSGAMMEACLTRGVQYHGLCLNRDHLQWLQAVADRAACGLISIEGSTLYGTELAGLVKEHFQSVLQSLVPAQQEEEALEPESGEE